MSERKPLPNISKRAPNARPNLRHIVDHDPSEAKTIQDVIPTIDFEDVVVGKKKKAEEEESGFVLDDGTPPPAPTRRR